MRQLPPAERAELAKWRREGKGIWHITFVVLGEDPEFTIFLPGRLSQSFAEKLARKKLSLALRVSMDDVIWKSTTMEGP